MNILIVSEVDCGGGAYELYKALKAHNHPVKQVVFRKNKLNYPAHIYRPDRARVKDLCRWADVLNIHWGPRNPLPYIPDVFLNSSPVIITYHGSEYRNNWKKYNARDKARGWLSTVVCIDLLRFCDNWLGRVMPDLSHLHNPDPDTFRVIHSPTQPGRKGTKKIKAALADMDGITLEVITGVTNAECIARKARGHLYVDRLGGKRLGFATNALEAWSIGLPVITDANPKLWKHIDRKMISVPFLNVSNKKQLRYAVKGMTWESERDTWIRFGRMFLKEYHSPKAVVKKFMCYCRQVIK